MMMDHEGEIEVKMPRVRGVSADGERQVYNLGPNEKLPGLLQDGIIPNDPLSRQQDQRPHRRGRCCF